MSSSPPLIRIGELSRRVGITTDRLRAWERRYRLLRPERTGGGFRLYSSDDERRVRAMQQHLAAGLSAAEAARAVLGDESRAREHSAIPATARGGQLARAFDAFDAPAAHALLDELFAELGVDDAMRTVLFPFLHDLGERWANGNADVAQEHFTTNLLQARLLSLLRSSRRTSGPMALLACAPGELHTLALIGFGIALHHHDWQTTYLGADTPIASLRDTAARAAPSIVVVSAAMSARVAHAEHDLRALARELPVALAGAGVSRAVADRVGARLLAADPVSAAAFVATTWS